MEETDILNIVKESIKDSEKRNDNIKDGFDYLNHTINDMGEWREVKNVWHTILSNAKRSSAADDRLCGLEPCPYDARTVCRQRGHS